MAKQPETVAQLKELWQIVRHRRWVILLAGVLLGASAIVVISLLPDWYSSSITILVDPQKIPDRYVSDTVTMDQLRLDTLSQQVLSLTRLEKIIDDLQLYPELRSCMPREDVVDYMRKNITIQIRPGGDRNPSAFTITYKGKDQKVVALVATRLADSFIDWDLAAREHQATSAADFVSTEFGGAKTALAQQEARLKEYKLQHLDSLPDQVPAKLNRLQTALQANIDAQNRLDAEKLMLTQSPAQPGRPGSPLDRTQLEEQLHKLEAQLTDLRSRYSDEYPDVAQVKDKLVSVRAQLSQLPPGEEVAAKTATTARLTVITRELGRLQEEQKSLTAQMNEYQAKSDELPVREQQLAELDRDYQNAKVHYQNLLEKDFSAGIATDLQKSREAERFSVLEPARIPEQPIRPHRRVMLALMLPFCFLFSVGSVVMLEISKGRICTERELRSILPPTVIVLGRIPVIATPVYTRRQHALASVAITGSLLCCIGIALFLWRVQPHF